MFSFLTDASRVIFLYYYWKPQRQARRFFVNLFKVIYTVTRAAAACIMMRHRRVCSIFGVALLFFRSPNFPSLKRSRGERGVLNAPAILCQLNLCKYLEISLQQTTR